MAERPRLISTLRARGAVLVPAMRYVLMASLVLAVVAMIWALMRAPEATEPAGGTPAAARP